MTTKRLSKREGRLFWKDIGAFPFPGGESWFDAAVRVRWAEETRRANGRAELYVHALGIRT